MITKTKKEPAMQKIAHRMVRTVSVLSYPLSAAVNLWVLHLALTAAGYAVSPLLWWLCWGGFYGLLTLACVIPHSHPGQWLGLVMTYAYSLHTLLFCAALLGLILLICLPLLSKAGVTYAGFCTVFLYAVTAVVGIYGMRHGRRLFLHVYSIKTDKCLPQGSLSIVHLSDLHLGYIQNDRFARTLVRKTNALQPDLICITGDIISDTFHPLHSIAETASILRKLHARYGVYACLGNHDTESPEEMADFFRKAGIRVLEDESLFPLPNIALIGRSDAAPGGIRRRRPSLSECMIGTDPLQFRIVLDHQPRDVPAAAKAGADLLLSGHTHGGQFFPASFAIRRQFPYCHGRYVCGSTTVIVSSGSSAGSPPIRLGSSGEIILITVRESEAT